MALLRWPMKTGTFQTKDMCFPCSGVGEARILSGDAWILPPPEGCANWRWMPGSESSEAARVAFPCHQASYCRRMEVSVGSARCGTISAGEERSCFRQAPSATDRRAIASLPATNSGEEPEAAPARASSAAQAAQAAIRARGRPPCVMAPKGSRRRPARQPASRQAGQPASRPRGQARWGHKGVQRLRQLAPERQWRDRSEDGTERHDSVMAWHDTNGQWGCKCGTAQPNTAPHTHPDEGATVV